MELTDFASARNLVSLFLDRADERILGELTHNARMSHAELAEKVNLSRNAVRQRIERLERDGQIQGYTIIVGDGTPRASPRSGAPG